MLRERAPAKLNLDLLVTGRRADGYHLLDSVVAFADAGDELSFAPAATLRLAITGPMAAGLPADETNLVLRAARALAARAGVAAGAAIALDKRLPVAGGIGGGSADAAAALRGLCRLWGVRLDSAELMGLALGLGADVPVCLLGRPARMRGIGERLDPVPALPPLDLVLVNPGRPLATAAVFRGLWPADRAPRPALPGEPAALLEALRGSRNDLEPPARAVLPAIGDVLEALASAPGCRLARMSGSGPTCFGIFAAAADADAAAATIAVRRPDWWVTACRSGGGGGAA